MLQFLSLFQRMEERNRRALVLVPKSEYPRILNHFVVVGHNNSGRTAKMGNGHMVSVITTDTKDLDPPEDYDLYFFSWGSALPQEEKQVFKWMRGAKHTYTEIQ